MENKKWYHSKTILSDVLTILLGAFSVIDKVKGTNIMGTEVLASILAILGALGIYGRSTATTNIK